LLYEDSGDCKYSDGICGYLLKIVPTEDGAIGLIGRFPEFGLFKPEKNEDGRFWWDWKDFDSRETALLFMIAMTE
jgi:hypothetical protein